MHNIDNVKSVGHVNTALLNFALKLATSKSLLNTTTVRMETSSVPEALRDREERLQQLTNSVREERLQRREGPPPFRDSRPKGSKVY